MKLAIHHRPGSFSERWIRYCKEQNIEYKLVNCYDTDIIKKLKGFEILLWHYHHTIYEDVLAARSILFALEHSGMKVFPNFKTAWHFDNKIAQKYLLESVDAPIVPTYVFYNKKEALEWANKTIFPKVFKLKNGSGSSNVKLVKTKTECIKLIHKSFGNGFKQFDGKRHFVDQYKKYLNGKKNLVDLLKAFSHIFISTDFGRKAPRERGYVYFQDFVENKGFDVRVVIINSKAVALKRKVRKNDFRASGSGDLIFEDENLDKRYIKLAFDLTDRIQSDCLAIDFIMDLNGKIYVVELSYGFPMNNFLDGAAGYWTKDLSFHKSKFNLQSWIIDTLIEH